MPTVRQHGCERDLRAAAHGGPRRSSMTLKLQIGGSPATNENLLFPLTRISFLAYFSLTLPLPLASAMLAGDAALGRAH